MIEEIEFYAHQIEGGICAITRTAAGTRIIIDNLSKD
jgi:hypothetical protein